MADKQQARADIREFLTTGRARITPEQAGLRVYGGGRRVAGLRREEVATLAGISAEYYIRLERGTVTGASDSVLDRHRPRLAAHRRRTRAPQRPRPGRRQ